MGKSILATSLFSAFLFGCSQRPDEVAFAVIDGVPLSVSSVSNAVMIRAKYNELAHRPIKSDRFNRWANSEAMRSIPALLAMRLMENEINRLRIVAEPVDRDKVFERYAKRLGGRGKQRLQSVDQLTALFGELQPVFCEQFERECKLEAYRRRFYDLEVGEDEISAYQNSVSNLMVKSEKINADAKRRGDEAWNRLNRGEPWEKVAPEYTEDAELDESNKDNWKLWDTFIGNGCVFDEVKEALPAIPVGGISKPLDTDEGLMIVKVLKREDDETTCARILIRLACLYEVPPRETVRAQLVQERLEATEREHIEEMREKADITYPLGTNFVYHIWPQPVKDVRQKEQGK